MYYPIFMTSRKSYYYIIFLLSSQIYYKDIAKYSWKLLWESSKDGFSKKACTDKVYEKPNILILIQLRGKDGPIIGGYTKIGWDKEIETHNKSTADKDAFLFYLKYAKG